MKLKTEKFNVKTQKFCHNAKYEKYKKHRKY